MLKPDVWLEFVVHINASKKSTCLKPFMVIKPHQVLYFASYFIYGIHSLKLNFAL